MKAPTASSLIPPLFIISIGDLLSSKTGVFVVRKKLGTDGRTDGQTDGPRDRGMDGLTDTSYALSVVTSQNIGMRIEDVKI